MINRNLKSFIMLLPLTLSLLAVLPADPAKANADTITVVQINSFVVGVEGPVIGVVGRIIIHASGTPESLVGLGHDHPPHKDGNTNFYDLVGTIDGDEIVLNGVIHKSTADLEGLPVRIEANSSTGVVRLIIPLSIFGAPFDLVFEGVADVFRVNSR